MHTTCQAPMSLIPDYLRNLSERTKYCNMQISCYCLLNPPKQKLCTLIRVLHVYAHPKKKCGLGREIQEVIMHMASHMLD